MNTKSQAAKSLTFKMSPAPHRPKAVSSDANSHQMHSQIKGGVKHQEHQEDEGCV
jgi:hypothetical protein